MLDIKRVKEKDKEYIKECIKHYIDRFINSNRLRYNVDDKEYISNIIFETGFINEGDVILYNSIYTIRDIVSNNYNYDVDNILNIIRLNIQTWNYICDINSSDNRNLWRLVDRISEIMEFIEKD